MLNPILRIYRSTVFRLSLIAAALFVASSFVVLGYIYYATVTTRLNAIDTELAAELVEFETVYEAAGANGVNQLAITRILSPSSPNLYLFQAGNNPATSNLEGDPIPETPKGPNETIQFIFEVRDGKTGLGSGVFHRARGRYQVLAPTTVIFVGRDVELIVTAAERVQRALLIAMLIAATLGIISGAYVSSRFARRIEKFNKLATDIQGGDFKRRAPVTNSGDELDDLAQHLNGMLDHIDRLMSAMRYAGDSIAHDLRSPLTRLRTSLEATATQVKDPEAQSALYDAADNANELLGTFESVLRIARLEAGDRRELLVTVDAKPLIDDLAELYEPSCEDAGLGFTSEIEGGHMIAADRGLLSQAVSNLLENAIKYTGKGGNIHLVLRKAKSGRVEISVSDDGPGIPAEQRQRVKERFVRLEQSRSLPGTGLGLSLVQAVADLHRAQFDLEQSELAETGLKAMLTFPRVKK